MYTCIKVFVIVTHIKGHQDLSEWTSNPRQWPGVRQFVNIYEDLKETCSIFFLVREQMTKKFNQFLDKEYYIQNEKHSDDIQLDLAYMP